MTATSITGRFLLRRVLMVHLAKLALKDRRAPKVLRVRSVLKDHKDLSARRVRRDQRVQQARLERRARREQQGPQDRQVLRDRRDLLDLPRSALRQSPIISLWRLAKVRRSGPGVRTVPR
jgi:hypothetical protein